MSDKAVYESTEVVDFYNKYNKLQPPEQEIFNKIESIFQDCTMLDIGVGGGRTTKFLANKVKKYIGIDYSTPMVDLCKGKFANLKHTSFLTIDVRNLSQFEDNSFDFILFSFNGIDHLLHQERVNVLKEICRIGKKGSAFVFSSHNIQTVNSLFSIKWNLGYKNTYHNIVYYWRLIYNNGSPKKYSDKLYARLNDGAHDFRLKLLYINPEYQIKQLTDNGFDKIELFALNNGEAIDVHSIDSAKDSWITYLCYNNKRQ